ncbi:hypothetical protein IWZ00DRAFT_325333 [Phyllosticta capitalensis]
MIPHNQDRCPHNAKTTSGSALIGTATSTTQPTKLTAHSYAGPPPPPNDDRMPRGYDTDRGHFVQDYRKPADAVPIPVPGMETGVGRSRSKPGASNAPKPSNTLHHNQTFSPFSANVSSPHYSNSAKRRPYEQPHAAHGRRSSDHDVLSDFQDGMSMRPSKRQRTEMLHGRSQSSPVGPTVDLTRDSPSSPLGQNRASMTSHHGQSSNAHSTASGQSIYARNFANEPYDSVHDKLTSFKKPREERQEHNDARPQPAMVHDRKTQTPSLNRLSKFLDSESSPSPKRRQLDIGHFNPKGRQSPANGQPGAEPGAHQKAKAGSQGAVGKSSPFFDNAAERPLQASSGSLKRPAPFEQGELEVFSVPSTQIFDDNQGLLLKAQPSHDEYVVLKKGSRIPIGRGYLSVKVAGIKRLEFSSGLPWRVQVVGPGGLNDWQRFEFLKQEEFHSFIDTIGKNVSRMVRRLPEEMATIFRQENGESQGFTAFDLLSPEDRHGLDRFLHDDGERSSHDSRGSRTNGRPRSSRPDHGADNRRQPHRKLVSQMRPESEQTPAEHGSSGILHPEQTSRRLTRSTNNVAMTDVFSGSLYFSKKQQEPQVCQTKYSQNPGFGKEWAHSVVFPTAPKARYRGVVCHSDLQRLDDGEFLNDSIISFCIAWSLNEAKEKYALNEDRIHIFSSFFCTKLWEPPTINGINYEAVQRWTTKIDLFSRDFIIVPVNDAQHWHLAIIINMKNAGVSLDEEAADIMAEEDTRQPQSELKSGVFKVLGPGKSESFGAPKRESQRNSPARGATKTKMPDPRRTTIIMLDSLGTTHPKTVKTLKQYIIAETKDKKNRELTPQDIQSVNVKDIPLQPNGYDCGVFVCGYFDKFIRDPDGFVVKIMNKQMNRVADWPDLDPVKMRRDTIERLLALYPQQHEERRQVKKKKREQIENGKSSTPKESSPEKPSTESSKQQSPAAANTTDPSPEPPRPMPEQQSDPAPRPARRRSPQVVVPTRAARLPEGSHTLKNANMENSFQASEDGFEQSLSKKPQSDDDDLLLIEEIPESKKHNGIPKSPAKKSKPLSLSHEGQKESSPSTAKMGTKTDLIRPGLYSDTRESSHAETHKPRKKPFLAQESDSVAQQRSHSPGHYRNLYSSNPKPMPVIPRTREDVEVDDSDDDIIYQEDHSEVDLVSTTHEPENDSAQSHQKAMVDAANDVFTRDDAWRMQLNKASQEEEEVKVLERIDID